MLTPKAKEMTFLGYKSETKGYCFLRRDEQFYIATTVTFMETIFPFCSKNEDKTKSMPLPNDLTLLKLVPTTGKVSYMISLVDI